MVCYVAFSKEQAVHLSYGQTRLSGGKAPRTPPVHPLLRYAQAGGTEMPPRKPDAEKLSEIIRVRFKSIEVQAIQENAEIWGMTPSAYIRALATGKKPKNTPIPVLDRQAYAELGRIGNNINQMARSLNQVHGIYPDHAEMVKSLTDLKQQINAIRLELVKAR